MLSVLARATVGVATDTDRAKWSPGEPSAMAEHHEAEEPDVRPDLPKAVRRTAPQSEYEMRQVTTGLAVFVVGMVSTFGLALGLTL